STKNITTRMRMPEMPPPRTIRKPGPPKPPPRPPPRPKPPPIPPPCSPRRSSTLSLCLRPCQRIDQLPCTVPLPKKRHQKYTRNCRIKSWHGNIKSKWQRQSQTKTLSQQFGHKKAYPASIDKTGRHKRQQKADHEKWRPPSMGKCDLIHDASRHEGEGPRPENAAEIDTLDDSAMNSDLTVSCWRDGG